MNDIIMSAAGGERSDRSLSTRKGKSNDVLGKGEASFLQTRMYI
jgi:hypothetical protein